MKEARERPRPHELHFPEKLMAPYASRKSCQDERKVLKEAGIPRGAPATVHLKLKLLMAQMAVQIAPVDASTMLTLAEYSSHPNS